MPARRAAPQGYVPSVTCSPRGRKTHTAPRARQSAEGSPLSAGRAPRPCCTVSTAGALALGGDQGDAERRLDIQLLSGPARESLGGVVRISNPLVRWVTAS